MIGSLISHYKILEKLGEGGMGIVYKAQDTKLNRTVALKFLPDRVNQDADAKARFLQEAQAAAALNHPNICTIFGVDEHNGHLFMSMEFVDGGTLREKLPFAKVNDALAIAVQIGEALHEAHANGIVHRDVKADNIMLTSKGQAKVMDFGLAKLKGSLKLTRSSSTVGTLGYMAPEQIQGGEVDHRSDIFSLGVLLFELMTGKLPFRGEHEAAIVYSIVNEQPESLKSFLPDAQAELMRVLGRALEKDPEDRYQSAADMVSELRHLLKQSSRVQRTAVHMPVPDIHREQAESVVEAAPASNLKRWAIGGGIGILLLGALVYGLLFIGGSNSATRATLNPDMTLHVLPIPFSEFSYPGLSKDGNWVAFPAANANTKWDIYYMHVSGSESRRITTDSIGSGFNLNADISPDGSMIAYQKPGPGSEGTSVDICVISSLGGSSKRIVQHATLARWRPDGQRIGFVRFGDPGQKGLYNFWSIRPDGSDIRLEFSDTLGVGGRFSRYSFNWSPDGRSIVWIRSFDGGLQEIITRELESGREKQLTFDKKNIDDVAWTKRGVIIFSSNRGGNTNLWVVPAEGGSPQQLTKGSGPDIGMSVSADDQRLVYLQQQQLGTLWIADVNSGRSRQLTFDDRQIESVALSPDGKRIAYTMGDIDPLKPGVGLYVQDRDGADRNRLVSEAVGILSLAWSPDGARIAFSMVRLNEPPDSARIYVINTRDPGEPKQLTSGIRATWINPGRLVAAKLVRTGATYSTYDENIGVDDALPPKRLDDSLSVVRVVSGNRLLLQDHHRKLWTVSTDYLENPSKVNTMVLAIPKGVLVIASSGSLYALDPQNRIWKIDYATGGKQQLRGSFPGLDFGQSVQVSEGVYYTTPWNFASAVAVNDEGSELAFVAYRFSAKLVMIENIFK
ncbi:MAG: protein kinase [Bacteroidota bacterium]